LRLLGELRVKKLLDVGCCGDGVNAVLLAKPGRERNR
jgi:hypothetical protein